MFCLSGANEACVTFVQICHFSSRILRLQGKENRDVRANSVSMVVGRKQMGEEESEKQVQTIQPFLHLTPAISVQPSVQMALVRLAD